MKIINRHFRAYNTSTYELAKVLDTMGSANDRIWPYERWPAIVMSDGLNVGSHGGNAPVQFTIEEYVYGERLVMRFTAPPGFNGTQTITIGDYGYGRAYMQHRLEMDPGPQAMLTWPLLFGPLHNYEIEDMLDKVAQTVNDPEAYIGKPMPVHLDAIRKLALKAQR